MKKLRIAYGRIAQETNCFTRQETTFANFERDHYREGSELIEACRLFGREAPGFTSFAELSGFVAATREWKQEIELVPLFSAWAMPAGPLAEETYIELQQRLERALAEAGPLDGIFFSLHGAMRAKGSQPEPEEGFLTTIREAIGPDTPLAISLDLHGQLTPTMVACADILVAYRTNPHWDLFPAGYRAGKQLVRAIKGEVRPVSAWHSLPMVLGGGETLDFRAPMNKIFRRMKRMERDPKVLNCSLFMCHIWNDSPDLGWSVHVVTDDDLELARKLAEELADLAWSVRAAKTPQLVTPQEAIEQVRRAPTKRRLGAFCLCDASDVVGAGAPGDSTLLLTVLLEEASDLLSYVPINDAPAVETLWATPIGTPISVRVGGQADPDIHPPIQVSGRVAAKKEITRGRAVALDLGHVKLVVSDHPPYTLKPSFYGDLGLNPWQADILVVKSFFHFRIFFLPLNRGTIGVKTRGATDFDLLDRIEFNRPVHPKQQLDDWREHSRPRPADTP